LQQKRQVCAHRAWLRTRSKKAAERNVLGALLDRVLRAREITVTRNADEHRFSTLRTNAGNVAVVATQMNAVRIYGISELRVIVDDEQDTALRANVRDPLRLFAPRSD